MIIDIVVDELAALLDDGATVEAAMRHLSNKYANIDHDKLLSFFKDVFLCTPEEYVENVKDDAIWAEENGDIIAAGFDEL